MRREIGDSVVPENRQLGYQPGDEAAMQIGLGLAQKFDAPTLMIVDKLLTLLEVVGGQGHIVALRREIASEEYETFGFSCKYQTRDVRLKVEPDPEVAAGWPITGFDLPGGGEDPPTVIPVEIPPEPEVAATQDGEAAQDDDAELAEQVEEAEEPVAAG